VAERCPVAEGVGEIVLRRKPKKRYLALMHGGRDVDALDSLTKRCIELFGHVVVEKAGLRLMRSDDDIIIVRCRLSQIHHFLVGVALTDPPLVAVDMSANIGRLRKRRHS
jgi:RNase P/RNase MRP subunit POP5